MHPRSKNVALATFALVATACAGPSGGASPTAAVMASPSLAPSATPSTRSAALSELLKTVEAREVQATDWQAAAEGEVILTGGGARTGDEARARVDITDGTIIRLGANTEFELVELSPSPSDPVTRFKLAAGKMWIMVSQALGLGSFEVETPVGVATVRGSLMSTEYFPANGHMIATCLEGRCRLTGLSGAFTELVGGQQSGIPGFGQDPGPAIPIDSVQLAQWGSEFPEAASIVRTIAAGPPPTPTPTPGPSGGGGQTACDHPYLPLRAGASWSYTTNTTSIGTFTQAWTVNSVAGDTSSATADMSWSAVDVQGTYIWECDGTGIVSYQFGALGSITFGQIATYQLVNRSGTLLPPADLLVPGYSWNNAYTIQYEVTVQGTSFPATASVSESYTVTGNEPVTVGGQVYDGLQISGSSAMEIQMQISGIAVPPTSVQSTDTYGLARGVGFVRWTSTSEEDVSTTELQSFSIP